MKKPPATMEDLVLITRSKLDDLQVKNEFDDDKLTKHIQNSLDQNEFELPLDGKSEEQIVAVEACIELVTGLKLWADGESYSYKNDAIQMTRGLLSKHFQDTIRLLSEQRDSIMVRNGGFY